MKSTVLFSALFLTIFWSCKKETVYKSTSIQDTIITPDTLIKDDTLVVRDTLKAGSDTVRYRKDSIVKVKKIK
ncbi:hypothetical protein RM51_10880 [Chryseobacterium taiwanense]|uniref:Uncharacterized protein n=1 Tax=Chryseobacterium taiwanense TaxID=363331 RepID=A0A0B4CN53_9FLAO|nr:hypothetical protein RM51_10880 [Chryseobacterium taiwanense]